MMVAWLQRNVSGCAASRISSRGERVYFRVQRPGPFVPAFPDDPAVAATIYQLMGWTS